MAALRTRIEHLVGARLYRLLFVIASFATSIPWLVYLVNHRNDGILFFYLHDSLALHIFVFIVASLAFFFLYPGTFKLSEIVLLSRPKQSFYATGIIRVTRHPQLVGMSLWCLSHFLWNASSFMLVTALGLIGYHLFAAWHSDRRRLALFGQAYGDLMASTSIFPFLAIFQGRQVIVIKEFKDKAYFWILVFIATVYYLHPAIVENFPKWYF